MLRSLKRQSLSRLSSLQSRRNFGERVLSNVFTKLLTPSLILITAEGWREKEICLKGAVDVRK